MEDFKINREKMIKRMEENIGLIKTKSGQIQVDSLDLRALLSLASEIGNITGAERDSIQKIRELAEFLEKEKV